jgi:hypothetical protein
MNLTLLLLLEGIILFFTLVTLVIVSPNVKTRSDAIKDGSVHQQERERAAWLSADGQYLRDHPMEKWLLPRTMIVFVAALGLTFLLSSTNGTHNVFKDVTATVGLAVQLLALVTFAVIQFRKRRFVWSEIRRVRSE